MNLFRSIVSNQAQTATNSVSSPYTNQVQNTPPTPPTSSLSSQDPIPMQPQAFTEEQKKMAEMILERIFDRVRPVLIDEDLEKIEAMDKANVDFETLRAHLISKVPNFDAIVQEEIAAFAPETSVH